MISLHDTRRPLFVLLITLVVLVGCGGGDGTVPVYGTVSFPAGPIPKGCRVFFQPLEVSGEGSNRPCFASVEEDGTYQVFAFKDANAQPTSKGILPGKYRVKITYYGLKPGADPNFESSWVANNRELGELNVDAAAGQVEHNIQLPQ